jgi:RNA:NAD 2'-phosphotransferase (TPT1/KptA family)
METSQQDTSKLISYWLRHNPKDANLDVDELGWVKIEQLLSALKDKKVSFTSANLIELNNSFDKVRWEIDIAQNRIRATHGHSFPVLLDEKVEIPPDTLYHGTASTTITRIIADGLLPMNRQFVHLSENIEMATIVAKRHGKPFIIEINAHELSNAGWTFYKTSDNVWLTTKIPIKYLSFEPWYPAIDKDNYFINELKREIGNRKSHFLYQHIGDLELVWNTGTCDDVLFGDRKTGKHYVVHLTYTKEVQEIDGFPSVHTYNSFNDWIEQGLWTDQQYYYDLDKATK